MAVNDDSGVMFDQAALDAMTPGERRLAIAMNAEQRDGKDVFDDRAFALQHGAKEEDLPPEMESPEAKEMRELDKAAKDKIKEDEDAAAAEEAERQAEVDEATGVVTPAKATTPAKKEDPVDEGEGDDKSGEQATDPVTEEATGEADPPELEAVVAAIAVPQRTIVAPSKITQVPEAMKTALTEAMDKADALLAQYEEGALDRVAYQKALRTANEAVEAAKNDINDYRFETATRLQAQFDHLRVLKLKARDQGIDMADEENATLFDIKARKLSTDPAWKDKSYEEITSEALRRTVEMVKPAVKVKTPAATPAPPPAKGNVTPITAKKPPAARVAPPPPVTSQARDLPTAGRTHMGDLDPVDQKLNSLKGQEREDYWASLSKAQQNRLLG